MSGRRGKESNLLLTRKIIVPRKFSKLISSHGSAISAENGVKSITPHQILNPDFNPVSPKLRVEIPDSSTNSDFNSSASQQYQQTGPNTESFTQKLPARKPFIARALRKQASAELEFEDQSEIDSLPSGRKTILELEAQLIQERQQLKQLQLEAVTVSVLVSCTFLLVTLIITNGFTEKESICKDNTTDAGSFNRKSTKSKDALRCSKASTHRIRKVGG